MIKLLIGPQKEEISFLVNTGTERSTIQKLPQGIKEGKRNITAVGVKGEPFKVPVLENVEIESQSKICLNDLLLLPEAEYNLLWRDLILKLGLNIHTQGGGLQIRMYALTTKDKEADETHKSGIRREIQGNQI